MVKESDEIGGFPLILRRGVLLQMDILGLPISMYIEGVEDCIAKIVSFLYFPI